jgi:hypothetical protein
VLVGKVDEFGDVLGVTVHIAESVRGDSRNRTKKRRGKTIVKGLVVRRVVFMIVGQASAVKVVKQIVRDQGIIEPI